MPDKVIISVDQVTTEWLTSVLAKSGALTNGNVASFDLGTGQGNWSKNANLIVRYSRQAQGALPQRLFLKMVNTDTGDDETFGDSEITYYTRDYVDVKGAPLIRCYDAAYSADLQRYHLLMDDLSETHVMAVKKEPTLPYGLALAEALAILHARWWGAERLAEAGAPIHSAAHIQRFVDIAEPGVEHILSHLSSELEPHWPAAIHTLYAKHPQAMIERSQDANGFTLIHGDAGDYNILVPHEGERPLYIIDRQPFNWSLTTWLGVYDLTYNITRHWNSENRRQWELPVLKHYHEHLIENGITNYSWQQLYDDYRLCIPMSVYVATEYCRGGLHERAMFAWLPMLKRALTACDDLDCSALW